MCGIFGSVANQSRNISENILAHRGPDSWGVEQVECNDLHVTLFHSRLSIIGLGEQGAQPFRKCPGKTLTYNGEIYNYLAIREELQKEGANFVSETDTEVLYEALCRWPIEEVLEKINGIFAFAFLDEEREALFLARDPLGIKPCYYVQVDDCFHFSSEAKSFFEQGLIDPILRRELLPEYFANGWVFEPDTLFEGVYKLEAGSFLTYDLNRREFEIERYWDINDKPASNQTPSGPDLAQIIEGQTASDVSVGTYFSGGVDSSIIALALKEREDILHLNLEMNDSESSRVEFIKKNFRLDIESMHPTNETVSLFRKLTYHMDEPVADPAIVPAYLLANRSRELGRIVMLAGMGGDEIDGGYTRHRIINNHALLGLARLVPTWSLKLLSGRMRRDAERLVSFAKDQTPENYYALTSYFNETEINDLVMDRSWKPDYREKIEALNSGLAGKRRFFNLDVRGFLTSHNLLYMDKASMAASIEVRVPLLDKDFAAFCFSSITKAKPGKVRLNSILTQMIGEEPREIRKQGFRYPTAQWLQNDVDWPAVLASFETHQLLNQSVIEQYIKRLHRDPDSVEMKLWTIYTLYLWLSVFDVKVRAPRSVAKDQSSDSSQSEALPDS